MKVNTVFNRIFDTKNPSIDDIIDEGLFHQKAVQHMKDVFENKKPFMFLTLDDSVVSGKFDEIKEMFSCFFISLPPDERALILKQIAEYQIEEMKEALNFNYPQK